MNINDKQMLVNTAHTIIKEVDRSKYNDVKMEVININNKTCLMNTLSDNSRLKYSSNNLSLMKELVNSKQ